jgi:hypothetical protein
MSHLEEKFVDISKKTPRPSMVHRIPSEPVAGEVNTQPQKRFRWWWLVLLAVIGLIIFLGYNYYLARERLIAVLQNNDSQFVLEEVNQTLDAMRKLTLLPNEVPVIATITDAAHLLRESAFYQGAEDGDQLVLFPEARRAYIYSPRRQIMVNAGPLILVDNGQAVITTASDSANRQPEILEPDQSSTGTASLEIRNGTPLVGEAGRLRDQLVAQGYTVSAIGNAVEKTYAQTLVIDLSDGQNEAEVAALVEELNAKQVTELPAGETGVAGDILIIIGNP